MCLANERQFDRKTRLIYSVANVSLLTGGALAQLGPRWGVHHQVLFDGLLGFSVGFSLTLLLWLVRLKRKSEPPAAGNT